MVPQITTPPRPLLPRQTADPNDPYGLSSFYAELSSLYPDLYSYSYDYSSLLASYSNDLASIMSEYSSLYPSYTYNYPIFTTGTAAPRVTSAHSNPTATAIPANGNGGGGKSGGLSNGAKIGIGVAVPLAVLLLAALGIFLWCAGKRKGKKTATTIVAPAAQLQPPPPQFQQHPQMYAQNQGYIPGYPHQQQTPPPHYMQPQPQGGNEHAAYGGYAKGPNPGAVELEQEYHFARSGAVELGDGAPVPSGGDEEGAGAKKSRFWRSGGESGK